MLAVSAQLAKVSLSVVCLFVFSFFFLILFHIVTVKALKAQGGGVLRLVTIGRDQV